MLFSYHLLYFCTALSLIIMLSSHYHHHKSKTFSQLTQCPFTGTLLLFFYKIPYLSRMINRKIHADLYHNFLIDYCRDFSHILHICTRPPVDSLIGPGSFFIFIKPSCACMLLFCLQSNTATDTVFRYTTFPSDTKHSKAYLLLTVSYHNYYSFINSSLHLGRSFLLAKIFF